MADIREIPSAYPLGPIRPGRNDHELKRPPRVLRREEKKRDAPERRDQDDDHSVDEYA